MKNAKIIAFGTALVAATNASAAFVTHTTESSFRSAVGNIAFETFESNNPGTSITSLDFEGEEAQVTTHYARQNRVHAVTDNHGAIAHEGDNFWKLSSASVTIEFTQQTTGFGFYYSDLEKVGLIVTIDNDENRSTTLIDRNPNTTDFFAVSDDQAFSSITITWTRQTNDGVGFDNIAIATPQQLLPTPGATALLATAGLLSYRRKRTNSQS
ncbi:MAG: hypothetical protein AAGB34_00315 [Planctomycetota bacterium]